MEWVILGGLAFAMLATLIIGLYGLTTDCGDAK